MNYVTMVSLTLLVFSAKTGSATMNIAKCDCAQHSVDEQIHKAFLGKGNNQQVPEGYKVVKKWTEGNVEKGVVTRYLKRCGCEHYMEIIIRINTLVDEAEKVEKASETAETEAKKLQETVAEVKAAKAEEVAAVSAQRALTEKSDILKDEVVKERKEVEDKIGLIKEQKAEAAKVVDIEAKKVVEQSEADIAKEVDEEELEAENKEGLETAVEKEATAQAMQAVEAPAETAAKKAQFKSEETSLEMEKELFDGGKIAKLKAEAYSTQRDVAGGRPPPSTAKKGDIVAEEIENAEIHRVSIALEIIENAGKQAKEVTVEQEKADKAMKEVSAKPEEMEDKIMGNMDTISELKKSIKKTCRPCKKKVRNRMLKKLKKWVR